MMRLIILCCVALQVAAAPASLAASTAQSQLKQQIKPVDCNHTTIQTGDGVVNDVDCPFFPPSIESINSNNGRPIVRGLYDAVHATQLRVFLGRWYVYGTDAELTTSGNVWRFSYPSADQPLAPGTYQVIVEMTDTNAQTHQDQQSFTVTAPDPTDPSDPQTPPTQPEPLPPISPLTPSIPLPLPPFAAGVGGLRSVIDLLSLRTNIALPETLQSSAFYPFDIRQLTSRSARLPLIAQIGIAFISIVPPVIWWWYDRRRTKLRDQWHIKNSH